MAITPFEERIARVGAYLRKRAMPHGMQTYVDTHGAMTRTEMDVFMDAWDDGTAAALAYIVANGGEVAEPPADGGPVNRTQAGR